MTFRKFSVLLFSFVFCILVLSIQGKRPKIKPEDTKVKDLGWYWGEWAFAYCKEKETKKTKGICAIIQEIVEDAFDDQGTQLQNAFGNALSDAEHIGISPSFHFAGERFHSAYLDWVFSKKITNHKTLKDEYIQRFFKWFAEILKEVDTPGSGLKTEPAPGVNSFHDRIEEMKLHQQKQKEKEKEDL